MTSADRRVSFAVVALVVVAALFVTVRGPLRSSVPGWLCFAAACTVGCFAVSRALRMPLDALGVRLPQKRPSARQAATLCALVLLGGVAAAWLMLEPGYHAEYDRVRALHETTAGRLGRFATLLVLVVVPLEVFLRGPLLFGVRSLHPLPASGAARIGAILAATLVDVALHTSKPTLELAAVAAGSPLLSWLSLRSESVVPALALHVAIEILFFIVVLA